MSQGEGRRNSGLRYFKIPAAEVDLATDSRLQAVARLPYVRKPVIALADLHWKENLETPSSTATATRDEIVLSFSSPSQNCGMTLLRTPFHKDEFSKESDLVRLMESIRESIPRSRKQPILTRDEAIRLAAGGAGEAARQFGIDPSMLAGIEQGGALFPEGPADAATVLDALDETCLEKGRYSFAFIGGGNHFLELQSVEEILEPEACRVMGLEAGQLVIMYHTGSERLGHDLGRLYGVRLKTSRRRRRKYFFRKIPLHLLRRLSAPAQLRKRWGYHFSRDHYIPVPADSQEGRRLQDSLRIAGNYGYANRVAVLDLILRGFQSALGRRSRDFQIISDLSHNVISREEIGGESLWVHRHNSVRLRPPSDWPEDSPHRRIGQPAMLPGTNRSSSYIIVSREGASSSLHSADHGAGRTVDRFLAEGRCSRRPERRTLKFTYASSSPEEVTHVTDEGIDEVAETLRKNDIAAAAAKLRPLAVLKG